MARKGKAAYATEMKQKRGWGRSLLKVLQVAVTSGLSAGFRLGMKSERALARYKHFLRYGKNSLAASVSSSFSFVWMKEGAAGAVGSAAKQQSLCGPRLREATPRTFINKTVIVFCSFSFLMCLSVCVCVCLYLVSVSTLVPSKDSNSYAVCLLVIVFVAVFVTLLTRRPLACYLRTRPPRVSSQGFFLSCQCFSVFCRAPFPFLTYNIYYYMFLPCRKDKFYFCIPQRTIQPLPTMYSICISYSNTQNYIFTNPIEVVVEIDKADTAMRWGWKAT